MKQIIFLALMIMPLLSFAGPSEVLLSLLKTPPSERIQLSSEKLNALETLKKLGIINTSLKNHVALDIDIDTSDSACPCRIGGRDIVS